MFFRNRYKIIKIVIISIPLIVLINWIIPFIKHKILTTEYGFEFIGLQKMTNMLDDVKYLKVLHYSNENASIYYYDSDGGNILEFAKQDNKWKMIKWNTIWSRSGSADDFIWPYIYHSAEGKSVIILTVFLYLIFIQLIFIIVNNKKSKHKQRNEEEK